MYLTHTTDVLSPVASATAPEAAHPVAMLICEAIETAAPLIASALYITQITAVVAADAIADMVDIAHPATMT